MPALWMVGLYGLDDDTRQAIRLAVAKWLRVRAEHEDLRGPLGALDREVAAQVLHQIAVDAEHSALLWRLLEGKDPLPHPPPLKLGYPDYDAGFISVGKACRRHGERYMDEQTRLCLMCVDEAGLLSEGGKRRLVQMVSDG